MPLSGSAEQETLSAPRRPVHRADHGGGPCPLKRARWKHGQFSAEARQEAAHFRQLLRECKELKSAWRA